MLFVNRSHADIPSMQDRFVLIAFGDVLKQRIVHRIAPILVLACRKELGTP